MMMMMMLMMMLMMMTMMFRFHTVGCLGYNAPEWALAHVAAVHAGGFGMGIYQVLYKVNILAIII